MKGGCKSGNPGGIVQGTATKRAFVKGAFTQKMKAPDKLELSFYQP